jgi:hypothetical protein
VPSPQSWRALQSIVFDRQNQVILTVVY